MPIILRKGCIYSWDKSITVLPEIFTIRTSDDHLNTFNSNAGVTVLNFHFKNLFV